MPYERRAKYATNARLTQRVCKTFFIKTLDILDRVTRTVKEKIDKHGILSQDQRGQHNNHIKIVFAPQMARRVNKCICHSCQYN